MALVSCVFFSSEGNGINLKSVQAMACSTVFPRVSVLSFLIRLFLPFKQVKTVVEGEKEIAVYAFGA